MDTLDRPQLLPRLTVVIPEAHTSETLGGGLGMTTLMRSIGAVTTTTIAGNPAAGPLIATAVSGVARADLVASIAQQPLIDGSRFTPIDLLPIVRLPPIALPQGMPRDQLTIPISPGASFDDRTLFASPDGAARYVLPRYRVATEQVIDAATGQSRAQFRIALAPDGAGGRLTIVLEKYPAPELGAAAQGAQELPHERAIRLRYQIPGGGAQEELIAQEQNADPAGLKVVFRVESAAKLTQLAAAISEPIYTPALVVTRAVNVAVPLAVAPEPPVISRGEGTLRGTWMFDLDGGAEGTSGDIWWEQETATVRRMTPRAGAQIANIGVTDFEAITFTQLQSLAYSTTPIDGSIRQIRRPRKPPIRRNPSLPPIHPLLKRRPIDGDDVIIGDDPIDDGGDVFVIERPVGPITNGDVFAVLTRQGNYAKVQVRQYGYNLGIRWVTYRRPAWPPGTQLYTAASQSFDLSLDPQPFVFPRDLHGYIYRAIGSSGQQYGLIRRTVRWNNQDYSYYQDEARPHVFKYLPDCFKIARRNGAKHTPWVSLSYEGPAEQPEQVKVKMDYKAAPVVDSARLIAAAVQLKASLNPPLPPDAGGLVFEPLLPAPNTTRLRIRRPGSAADVHTQAVIDMRAGIDDLLVVPIAEFPTIYAALLSDVSAFLEGWVEVDIGAVTERIPFIARLSDLAGDLFTYERGAGDGGAIAMTLRNAIESPVRIGSLAAVMSRAGAQTGIAATIAIQGAGLPLDLAPGAGLALTLTPNGDLPGEGDPTVSFDFSNIAVQPDARGILRAISASVGAAFTRTITVRAFAPQFDPPADRPADQIISFVVNFATGGSVELTDDKPQNQATVNFPYNDFILSQVSQGTQTGAAAYSYSLIVVRQSGVSRVERSSSDTTLVIDVQP